MDKIPLPNITITAHDLSRLDLLTGLTTRYRTPAMEFLARELRRAQIFPSYALPGGIVNMHSRVRYRSDETGAARTATLVYPGEEDSEEGKVSILTPVGSALIGLSAGQSIRYEDADGRTKTLTVLEVLSQPEPSRPAGVDPFHPRINDVRPS
jgi:regulator of nucleoside diphosphate kinase